MPPDLWSLYELMLRSRLFEVAIAQLWNDGLISGEMHLGTGEEAINAGVISQLREGDAMALDHRGSGPLIMRGVNPLLIVNELLGHPDGLCGGMGGHMHLYHKESLSASSGIVGAGGPTAAGFALASQYKRPGTIAVSFFGEAAINQGMLMESMNLASVWKLPVLYVCKDDGWGITSNSKKMTGGSIRSRIEGFGIPVFEVDGKDVIEVWQVAESAVALTRSGTGPTSIIAGCVHLDGHLMGFQLLRLLKDPTREIPQIAGPLSRSFLQPHGTSFRERFAGLRTVLTAVIETLHDPRRIPINDPIVFSRSKLLSDTIRLEELEDQVKHEVMATLASIDMEVAA